jgi:hypothetical protein
MIRWQKVLQVTAIALSASAAISGTALAQPENGLSCAETMTEQLRRYSESCLSDLISFVASQPDMTAKVYNEKEKYYVVLTRTNHGLLAEAVSKFNYPLMKADTPDILKHLGWAAPENESDNWKKDISRDKVKTGGAVQELSNALSAYGLRQGEAISLTVGPKLSDRATSG